MSQSQNETLFFFIGSYAEADSTGVYVCSFNTSTGVPEIVGSYAGLQNPTFLAVNASRKKLYALSEAAGPEGAKHGAVAAFDINGSYGLSLLNIEETVPAPTCHLELDQTGDYIMVASYHGGMIGLSPIAADGRVSAVTDMHRHQGASILPVQDRPRAHSVTVDRNNRFAVVCDLGTDRIVTYRLDTAEGKLTFRSDVQVSPGAGPRHFAFHPLFPFGYVINELNSTVTVFHYDEANGTLTEAQTVPTLPEDYHGENACADIHISPDGKFLYGSNRGHDSIAVYGIGEDGRLTLVEHVSVLGRHPRNFALTPDGAFLLAANRDTDNVVIFARDADSGKLAATNQSLSVSKPVCIAFYCT